MAGSSRDGHPKSGGGHPTGPRGRPNRLRALPTSRCRNCYPAVGARLMGQAGGTFRQRHRVTFSRGPWDRSRNHRLGLSPAHTASLFARASPRLALGSCMALWFASAPGCRHTEVAILTVRYETTSALLVHSSVPGGAGFRQDWSLDSQEERVLIKYEEDKSHPTTHSPPAGSAAGRGWVMRGDARHGGGREGDDKDRRAAPLDDQAHRGRARVRGLWWDKMKRRG